MGGIAATFQGVSSSISNRPGMFELKARKKRPLRAHSTPVPMMSLPGPVGDVGGRCRRRDGSEVAGLGIEAQDAGMPGTDPTAITVIEEHIGDIYVGRQGEGSDNLHVPRVEAEDHVRLESPETAAAVAYNSGV